MEERRNSGLFSNLPDNTSGYLETLKKRGPRREGDCPIQEGPADSIP
jgi:hypothetical protein